MKMHNTWGSNIQRLVFFIFLFSATTALTAQELPFTVTTTSRYSGEFRAYRGELRQGTSVNATNTIGYTKIFDDEKESFSIWVVIDSSEYRTYAKNFVPQNTSDLFGKDVLIDFGLLSSENLFFSFPNEMWVPTYYSDVLKSKNREMLTTFEPNLPSFRITDEGHEQEWYDPFYTDIYGGMYMFFNAGIRAGYGHSFLIRSISKTGYGYAVDCIGPDEVDTKIGPAFDWSAYNGGDGSVITLLLYLDGDYLDMYMNDTAHKFGTLVRVKEEFITQYQSLIHDNTCDLANVQWPQRAAKKIETGKTYTTVENLRLRTTESRDSETIATLPAMTAVQVLEKGAEDTMDSIKANWVKVRLGDGTEGWCFGGYLVPFVELPVIAQEAAVIEETPEVAAKPGESVEPETEREIGAAAAPQKAPLPWFIIGGGVLVLAGGGVLFLARKRKGRG